MNDAVELQRPRRRRRRRRRTRACSTTCHMLTDTASIRFRTAPVQSLPPKDSAHAHSLARARYRDAGSEGAIRCPQNAGMLVKWMRQWIGSGLQSQCMHRTCVQQNVKLVPERRRVIVLIENERYTYTDNKLFKTECTSVWKRYVTALMWNYSKYTICFKIKRRSLSKHEKHIKSDGRLST